MPVYSQEIVLSEHKNEMTFVFTFIFVTMLQILINANFLNSFLQISCLLKVNTVKNRQLLLVVQTRKCPKVTRKPKQRTCCSPHEL